ncbi:tautomerase family protein [Streptomyces sp. MS06]|uniref:tautomerase family protein n=1 Tax=Streptomyces sp. MS06 TaxID=3385974 RepID=UPI0039A2F5A8
MPIIRVSLLEGWSQAQKARIAHDMTQALVGVLGEVSRPFVYAIVEEMQAGAVAFAGNLITAEMNEEALALSRSQLATKVTPERVDAAYAALRSGDAEEVSRYWADDVLWSVPPGGPLAGTRSGLGEFTAYLRKRADPAGGTFHSEGRPALVTGDTTLQLRHDSWVRDDAVHAVDRVHLLHWREGRVVAGREAEFAPTPGGEGAQAD